MGALIPQQFIDELLLKTDIVHFIDSYVPLKKQGTSHSACCPFHDEKTPSFNVIPKKQFYHCFGCGVSGNVISFAMSYLNQDFPEAIETLAARAGLEIPRESQSARSHIKSLPLYELLSQVAIFYQKKLDSAGHAAAAYLKNRGVGAAVIKRYQIGYAPTGWHALEQPFKPHLSALITTGMLVQKDDKSTYDRYRHRITFPIHDRHGRLIGFGGRAIDADQKPKYLNSPETVIFQKNRELYGLYQVLETYTKNPESVLIVEGYMDVVALAEHGILNAVATLGTATSTYHVQLLSKHTKTLVFCFDGDAAGKKAALRALENTLPALDGKLNAQFIFLPEGEDPDSLVRSEGAKAFTQRFKHATPLHEHLLHILTEPLDMTGLAGRSQLLEALIPYWEKIPDGPYKQLLLDEVARLTHLDVHRIDKILGEKQPIPNTTKTSTLKRTPVRLATALLLQHPEIYAATHTALPALDDLVEPNQAVLKKLLQHLANHPDCNTATLVELFRETALFDAINKLAAWNHQVPTDALSTEFTETVQFLAKKTNARKVETLIEKARHQSLTASEQQTLQAMLKNRHRPATT
ncbi:MAG: DNA primase [Gammaproteobacteria bacterium]|nr:DNA primase [Gammaproteobacteria bacterium]MCH9717956.1 DNA primase [Gammaproteobacteria bacterium]MCH9762905.1 DNA primase [Gammaproteobacteria bacterium]